MRTSVIHSEKFSFRDYLQIHIIFTEKIFRKFSRKKTTLFISPIVYLAFTLRPRVGVGGAGAVGAGVVAAGAGAVADGGAFPVTTSGFEAAAAAAAAAILATLPFPVATCVGLHLSICNS